MRVTWQTKNAALPAVKWGPIPGVYPWTARGASDAYARADMCPQRGVMANVVVAAGRGWLSPGRIHSAVMSGLKAGATYYYVYGNLVSCVFGLFVSVVVVSVCRRGVETPTPSQ